MAQRNSVIGDSLDVIKTIARRVNRPLRFEIGLDAADTEGALNRALSFHFGDSPHEFRIREACSSIGNPWMPDVFKSGSASEGQRILVTRNLYEGNPEHDELFRYSLESLAGEFYTDSQLSWDGEDFQFTLKPSDLTDRPPLR